MLSRTQVIKTWKLVDLFRHQPNCSTISDTILKEALGWRWRSDTVPIVIPYGFSLKPYLEDIIYAINNLSKLTPMSIADFTDLKNLVSLSLHEWSKASNGLLKFKEVTSVDFNSPGIFFNMANFVNESILGMALRRIDNNKQLYRVYIFFSYDHFLQTKNKFFADKLIAAKNQAELSMLAVTPTHEIGHALGFGHLHAFPTYVNAIEKVPDGVYCSVMPYQYLIVSPENQCKEFCNMDRGIFPGELDKRMVDLSYVQNHDQAPHGDFVYNFTFNTWNTIIWSLLIAATHHYLDYILKNFSIREGKFLSILHANLLADLTMLGLFLTMGFSLPAICMFLFVGMTKYLPQTMSEDMKEILQTILISDIVLNVILSYQQGQRVYPLINTLFLGMLSTYLGSVMGQGIGIGTFKLSHGVKKHSYALAKNISSLFARSGNDYVAESQISPAYRV